MIDTASGRQIEWKPVSAAQEAALRSPAELLMFGGAAGGGKSEVMLVAAAAHYDKPGYHAVIFRRTFPELQQLIDRSHELYESIGGKYNAADRIWRWRHGATIEFKYLDKDADIYKRQGFEYQFVGFDESTHFLEKQVRYLINSRMRSKEGIPMRVVLTTNPGNRGGAWHRNMFIGKKCLHCLQKAGVKTWPAASRHPYELYHDAKWLDGVPVGMSTMFIPSKVTDHNLFGPEGRDYVKKLKGLPLAFQLALLEGCWDAFEGQYFDCFDHEAHVFHGDVIDDGDGGVPLVMKPWWPCWVGIDYGFSQTHACVAYLNTRSTTGRIFTLDEYVIHHRKAVDVASDLQALWGDYNIKAWYLSPDAFDHDGTADYSRAEMMRQETGLGFEPAYNDRISGAMLMYQLLADHKWRISDKCELLIASLPSRVHDDDKRAEDVKKLEEDEDDSYDGARYSIASFIKPGKIPMNEELLTHVTSSDPTSAMMQWLQAKAKFEQVGKPMFYKGGARSR